MDKSSQALLDSKSKNNQLNVIFSHDANDHDPCKDEFILKIANDLSENLAKKLNNQHLINASADENTQKEASRHRFVKNRRQRPKSYVENSTYQSTMPTSTSADKNSGYKSSKDALQNSPAFLRHQRQQQILKNTLLGEMPSNDINRSYMQFQSMNNYKLNQTSGSHSHLSISDIKNFSSNLANGCLDDPVTATGSLAVDSTAVLSTSAPYSTTLSDANNNSNRNANLNQQDFSHVICKSLV